MQNLGNLHTLLTTLLSYRKIDYVVVGLINGDEAMKVKYDDTLKLMHAGLENAPQTTLQLYIVITTWGSTG